LIRLHRPHSCTPLFPYTTLFRSGPIHARPPVTATATAPAPGVPTRTYAWYALGLLTFINLLNYLDRNVIFALFEPIKAELALSRSEEHTSELQSRENLVCRLLLE